MAGKGGGVDERLMEEGDDESVSSLSKVAASISDGQEMVMDNGVDESLYLFVGNAVNDETALELAPLIPS